MSLITNQRDRHHGAEVFSDVAAENPARWFTLPVHDRASTED